MGRKRYFLPILLQLCAQFSLIHTDPTGVNPSCEYESMTRFLQDVANNYTQITQLVSIGTTEEGREIWTMIVSDSPYKRPLLRPQAKFVGNVNGVSGPACYVLLRLIKHLVEQYRSEASLERKLLENVEIHIIPNLNLDGYAKAVPGSCFGKEGRNNANDVDLNSNFPDLLNPEEFEAIAAPLQKETIAMMRWIESNKFTVSVSLISGAKVVVYPFDAVIVGILEGAPDEGFPHFTPDDDIFRHLALTYARRTGTPEMGWYCPTIQREFPLGIVNGAEWKPKIGTMMDYNYLHGTFEITVALSCCRNPDNSTILDEIWRENREGLLHVIHEVGTGIRGQVLDAETLYPIPDAILMKKEPDYVEGEDSLYSPPFFSTEQGEFWRPWRPGVYKLRVEKVGYKTELVDVEVHRHQPTFIRVKLEKEVTAAIHHERFTASTTTTPSSTSSSEGGGGGRGENESIKKMTASHQPDDFSSNKRDSLRINDYELTTTSTTTTTKTTRIMETSGNESETVQETPVVRSSTSIKHYSSLTQLDHSFINLLRGIGNCGSCIKCLDSVYKIITMCLLAGFLTSRYQLAVKRKDT